MCIKVSYEVESGLGGEFLMIKERCVVCEFLLADIFHKSDFYLLGILDNFLS